MGDPRLPFYSNHCKCSACGEYFTCDYNFRLHRHGHAQERRCLDPSTLHDKNGIARLRRNDKGLWAGTRITEKYYE